MIFAKAPEMKDVCFEVFHCQLIDNSFYQVRGHWWNLALGEPFPITGAAEALKVSKKKFETWTQTNNPRRSE